MERSREKSANQLRYYPDDAVSVCALCGNELGSVYFKGKIVCEECLDVVKELY